MKSVLLLTEIVLKSKLFTSIRNIIPNSFVYNVTESCDNYIKLFKEYDNIITWNCKLPHSWVLSHNKNVLFLDNSMLHQASGVFLDSEGMFYDSHLAKNVDSTEYDNIEEISDFIKSKLNLTYLGYKRPYNNNILVLMQNNIDSNIRFQYPLLKESNNKMRDTIKMIEPYISKYNVHIRPHPKFLKDWDIYKPSVPSIWHIDTSKNIYESLCKYDHIIGINSTTIHECIAYGIPTSALGVGSFTNYDVVNDCSSDLNNLNNIEFFTPNEKNINRYITKLYNENFLSYNSDEISVRNNKHFNIWYSRCK